MNKFVFLFLAAASLTFAGCAENLETLVQDPAFRNYEKKLEAAEKAYLNKQISYAEYLEQRRAIEAEYARDVRPQREAVSDVEVMKENTERPEER